MAETKRKTAKSTQGVTKTKIRKPSMYDVLMHNDDITPMDFVVEILEKYFDKNAEDAKRLMLSVHHGTKAVAGTYTYDMAVTKMTKAVAEARNRKYPFKMTVEKSSKEVL